VATISRLLKIYLFCRIWSLCWGSFALETYNFKEPTNRSHPILASILSHVTCMNTYIYMPQTGKRLHSHILQVWIHTCKCLTQECGYIILASNLSHVTCMKYKYIRTYIYHKYEYAYLVSASNLSYVKCINIYIYMSHTGMRVHDTCLQFAVCYKYEHINI